MTSRAHKPRRYLCVECGETDASKFYSYIGGRCKTHYYAYQHAYRQRNLATKNSANKDRKYTLKKRYNITLEEYDRLFDQQKGLCAACGTDPRTATDSPKSHGRLHIDHDHATNKVRGLLCNGCNRALGFINDSPLIARGLASYLDSYQDQLEETYDNDDTATRDAEDQSGSHRSSP